MAGARLITATDLRRALRPEPTLTAIGAGFRMAGNTPPYGRPPADPGDGTAAAVPMPGRLPGIPAFSVTLATGFPGAEPKLTAVVLLFDAADGGLRAILHGPHPTALRSGAVAALGSHVLARSSPSPAARPCAPGLRRIMRPRAQSGWPATSGTIPTIWPINRWSRNRSAGAGSAV
jgi:ornithine cyclodeaminase/alanine dehydrogenase-like protein (mu-crystallin family)